MGGKRMDKDMMDKALETVKFGSKLEAKWTETLTKAEESIMVDGMNLEISEAIVNIAKKHIAEEKEKLK